LALFLLDKHRQKTKNNHKSLLSLNLCHVAHFNIGFVFSTKPFRNTHHTIRDTNKLGLFFKSLQNCLSWYGLKEQGAANPPLFIPDSQFAIPYDSYEK